MKTNKFEKPSVDNHKQIFYTYGLGYDGLIGKTVSNKYEIGNLISKGNQGLVFELIQKQSKEENQDLIIKISPRKENLKHEIDILRQFREKWSDAYPHRSYSGGPLPVMTAYGCFLMNDSLLFECNTNKKGQDFY